MPDYLNDASNLLTQTLAIFLYRAFRQWAISAGITLIALGVVVGHPASTHSAAKL